MGGIAWIDDGCAGYKCPCGYEKQLLVSTADYASDFHGPNNYCPQCETQYILHQTTRVEAVGKVDKAKVVDMDAKFKEMHAELMELRKSETR